MASRGNAPQRPILDFFQKYKRVAEVFLAIALTFATWGNESCTQFRGARDSVATVNGFEISQREFRELTFLRTRGKEQEISLPRSAGEDWGGGPSCEAARGCFGTKPGD